MNRILVVEDEKMIRHGIHAMIENSGVPFLEIEECRNGKDAVDRLQEKRYDLVLTDVRMPFMDGIELTRWIRENLEQEEQPIIIALSGYSEFEYVKSMMKAGIIDYILKPIDRDEFYPALWRAEQLVRSKAQENRVASEDEGEYQTFVNRKKMQDAVDYILRNYRRPLNMAEVSNYVSMNYTMFSSQFKRYTNQNFPAFLRSLRVEKAKNLLRNTDIRITEISRQVGYEDAGRLTRVFKEETGMTPKDYRETPID